MPNEAMLFKWIQEATHVDSKTIRASGRQNHIVYARGIFCAIARNMAYSLPSIGKFVKRDHSTVLRIIRNIERTEKAKTLIAEGVKYMTGIMKLRKNEG